MHRTLVESPLYEEQLKQIGGGAYLDEALSGVAWALSTNPEEGLRIPNTQLWLIKTLGYEIEGHYIAPLSIWYTLPDENTVLLLSITETPAFSYDDIISDDDIPF